MDVTYFSRMTQLVVERVLVNPGNWPVTLEEAEC